MSKIGEVIKKHMKICSSTEFIGVRIEKVTKLFYKGSKLVDEVEDENEGIEPDLVICRKCETIIYAHVTELIGKKISEYPFLKTLLVLNQ